MKRIAFAALAAVALAGCQDASPTELAAPPADANPSALVSMSLDCPASVAVGQLAICTALAYDTAGAFTFVSPSTWSNNPGVLSVSGTVIHGQSVGSATVTATYNGLSASSGVRVVAPPQVATVTLSPTSATVRVGSQRKFTATAKDQYGNTISGQAVTWSTTNSAVATVDATGLVTGQGLGTTTITATVLGVTGSATVTGAHAVTLAAPDFASDQNVQVTATALPAGSYYYQWYTRACTMSGPCPSTYTSYQGGPNLTSVPVFVSRHDITVNVRVDLKSSSTGAVLATSAHIIHGDGVPLPVGEPGSCSPRVIC